MAQALFDEHPLEEYLRNAGEIPEFMPGSSAELELELGLMHPLNYEDEEHVEYEWHPLFPMKMLEVLQSTISAMNFSSQPSPFVERFKYDVISSSLLAVSLPSAHGRTPRNSLPGQLVHSRTPSTEATHDTLAHTPVIPSDTLYMIPSLALVFVVALFSAGYTLMAVASLGATSILMYNLKTMNETPKCDMSSSLESLHDLIASSDDWESTVQDAIDLLENDERSPSYGAATPAFPSSSICVALLSSLHTTQTQCDNVRHLFSALTSPSELSQLSEMYAPPSPIKPNCLYEMNSRPLSLPSRKRTSSMPSDAYVTQESKRSTWNGSYTNIAHSGSPVFRRREKRRSDLSSLLQPSSSQSFKTMSAPVTPLPASPGQALPRVHEESVTNHDDGTDQTTTLEFQQFGAAALDLHRMRKSAGMEAFKLPPPSYFSPIPSSQSHTSQSPRTPPTSTLSSGSRFTPIQASRHPLSLSALHHALQGAMASKRYACSHLLALRFTDEEDEGYWEDVRSVMELLTSTLVDASSRLAEALEDVKLEKLRDQNLTPGLTSMFPASEDGDEMDIESDIRAKKTQSEDVSFAPLPSHLSRFAAHVEAITTALDDAKENLKQCVESLREEHNPAVYPKRKRRPRSSVHASSADLEESLSLQAYERLRRELGLALRECERGRERLFDLIFPVNLHDDINEDGSDGVPALGHDASDDSDKHDPTLPFDDEAESDHVGEYSVMAADGADDNLDDVTSHLLLAASAQHPPSPGIEQVFEADSGTGTMFTRERSKLTREERIQLMKARREGGGSGGPGFDAVTSSEKRGVEKWGPGGEVVQELKDVIWKVGERRRQMAADRQLHSVMPSEI